MLLRHGLPWLFLLACIEPRLHLCGDVVCALDATCIQDTRCASPPAVAACDGLVDGDACMTSLFGGACAMGACWADDRDGDFVIDTLDNCGIVANPSQQDLDGDGVGDACDRCPLLVTPTNHDEDGDRVGDECDVCPALEDFQKDVDRNGVGDACPFGVRRLFDPFLVLSPAWTTEGAAWNALGDSIVPPPGALPLLRPDIELAFPDAGMLVNLRSARPWTEGDVVGLRLRNQDGSSYAFCEIRCGPSRCSVRGYLEQFGNLAPTEFQPSPTLRFGLGLDSAGGTSKSLYCTVTQENGTTAASGITLFTAPISGVPEIESQSGIEIEAFEAFD
jgi:Thrombospondin type 3 repeat